MLVADDANEFLAVLRCAVWKYVESDGDNC